MEYWKGERRRQETEDSMQNWNSGIMEGWENKIQKTAKEKPFSHRVTEKTQRKIICFTKSKTSSSSVALASLGERA